jgi:hypothetical protein
MREIYLLSTGLTTRMGLSKEYRLRNRANKREQNIEYVKIYIFRFRTSTCTHIVHNIYIAYYIPEVRSSQIFKLLTPIHYSHPILTCLRNFFSVYNHKIYLVAITRMYCRRYGTHDERGGSRSSRDRSSI